MTAAGSGDETSAGRAGAGKPVRAAVAGSAGMLGRDLSASLASTDAFRYVGAYDARDGLDLTDEKAAREALVRDAPGVVFNCAAYTNVDGAETDPGAARRANRDIPAVLSRLSADLGFRLVHVGSDYAFDGTKRTAYTETDPPNPQSEYGRSKLEGDREILESGCDAVIARTSWLYGRHGKNFVDTMLALAAKGGPLNVVTDQRGCPTWTVELAGALLALARTSYRGIVNFCGAGDCTWNEFAREIFRQRGIAVDVLPITTEALGRPAKRPLYSVLDTSLYTRLTGRRPMQWADALRHYLAGQE